MDLSKVAYDTAWVIDSFLLKGQEPTIHSENEEYLKACREYIVLAKSMPYQEILLALREYDSTHPKPDEIKFVRNLQEKYNQTEKNVLMRIKYVRRLSKLNWVGNNI
jgi:hypothetical protein